MSNIAYEALGRVTWALVKRKLRNYFVSDRRRRVKRGLIVLGVVAVGAVVAGTALERASAQ
ncbi:MAG: hypothetical protein HYX29_02740 [Solirubrobacterales bacterium]|nr:hypothetical protein [Solirubrobacterales bacterium]